MRRKHGCPNNKNDYSSLKPGDIVHFSPYSSGTTGHVGIVVANLGNGKVEIVDARGKAYGVVRRVVDLSQNSHYLGATSATQVLINNGYTPVNADGTVVAPAGSTVPGQEGRMQNFEKNYKRSISFDEIASQYQAIVKERVIYLAKALIPIISLLFAMSLSIFLNSAAVMEPSCAAFVLISSMKSGTGALIIALMLPVPTTSVEPVC